ncbi:MAG: VWA domain-containing protein [Flavobacteriaceae bacterium]|nr:VWA domain-containing protein [Flavobacteriaceae bacterium]MCY4268022.1 VWA domain-containing protein [Flavobacteriaceae bacterium]MCY4298863.1 VWA domain-containing protein [Flavobacteriaceae bacterium]
MYQLDNSTYFYSLLLLPILWLGYYLVKRWKRKAQRSFATSEMLDVLSPNRSKFKPGLKLFLYSLVMGLLSISLVNPKIGSEVETVRRQGVDIVFAVDVSKSMLAEDVAPNRIEKAKHLVHSIISELVSDRVGIVAYAAQAIPQLPITTDYGAAKMFLQALNTDMLSSQGTALSSAIDLSSSYFDQSNQVNKIIFLLTDGEDHQQQIESAVEASVEKGIKIFTIGIGTETGAPIPIKRGGVIESYKKDLDGNVVITQRNSQILQNVALMSQGKYQDGNDTQAVLDFVAQALGQMDKKEFESQEFVRYKDRFQPFIFIAIVLLFLDIFIFETKTKWIQRINLFNENQSAQ